MTVQREDPYCALPAADGPQCAVWGCIEPPAFEVFTGDYNVARERLRGRRREKIQTRRAGDERLFACRRHMETEPRMAGLRWQRLLF
jgi:hypothetical protein